MSDEIEDDEEGATQMMTSRSLVGDARPDTLDEEEGDLTVPFDRGAAFAQAVMRPRPAAGTPAAPRVAPAVPPPQPAPRAPVQTPVMPPAAPARPRANEPTTPQRRLVSQAGPEPAEPDLETGSITVPVVRDDLPLPNLSEFGDTGEMTVPRGLAPKAPEPRPVPRYDLPPPAYKPPPPQAAPPGARPGSVPPPAPFAHAPAPRPGSIPPGYIQSTGAPIPVLAQAHTPPPIGHGLAQMPTPPPPMTPGLAQVPTPPPPMTPGLAQMPTPPPQGPMSQPAPSFPVPSAPSTKVRSPPVFIAVMVACTVLTVTGLLLLVYLKVKGFW